MSQSIQRSHPPTSHSDYFYDHQKNYGAEETEGSEFPDEGYDSGFEEPDALGDGYVDSEGGESSRNASSVDDLRFYLLDLRTLFNESKDVKERSKIQAEMRLIENRINRAVGMSGATQSAEFGAIMAELSHVESTILGQGEAGEVDPVTGEPAAPVADAKQLKKDLEKAIDDIDERSNLTDDEKIELKSELERLLTELDIHKEKPEEIDPEEIATAIADAKKQADELDAYTPGAKGLSKAFDISPEVLKGKAEAKGIDIDSFSVPPTIEQLKFLAELSPELQAAFKKVEDAINERAKFYENNLQAANSINDANDNSTTDADNADLQPWQHLFDLKHFQDAKSQDVMHAMQEAVQALIPILQALYPDSEVKVVESNATSGWEKTQDEYKIADKIKIGNVTLDLFNNSTGKIQSNTGADDDITIDIPDICADGEGDGEWDPPDLQTYGDKQPGVNWYGDGG